MTKTRDKSYSDSEHRNNLVELPDIETFRIGERSQEKAATTLGCKLCGGIEFNVGWSNYYLAVKCPKCGWEYCLADG